MDVNFEVKAHGELCYVFLNSVYEPLALVEVQKHEEKHLWKEAMDAEMAQLADLGTWTLEDLPEERSTIGRC